MKLESGEVAGIPEAMYSCSQQAGLGPLPTMVNTGPVELPPLAPFTMFLAGFTDCAEEAIRYLTEVEGFSEDHPLVEGLKQHLAEQQKLMDIQYILKNSLQWTGGAIHEEVVPEYLDQSDSVMSLDSVCEDVNENCVQVSEDLRTESTGCVTDETLSLDSKQSQSENSALISSLAAELFSLLQEECEMYSDSEDDDEVCPEAVEQ